MDDARDLRERAMYAPSGESRWKVYIIDEAHMLTREAWNALLKILEEPPSRVVFVFATTEPQKIAQFAAPVLSRLQRFDFKRIGLADIRERLIYILAQEKVDAEPEALSMIARAADGSMRDALSLSDQVLALGGGRITALRVRDALGLVAEDEYIAILDLIAGRRGGEVFGAVARLVDSGVDLGVFLAGFAEMLRAMLAVTLGAPAGELSEAARTALEARKGNLPAGDLLRMLTALAELEPRFRRSTQQQLLLETTLVRFALLDHTVAIEDLLERLPEGSGGTPDPSPRAGGDKPRPAGSREGKRTGGAQGGDAPRAVPRLADTSPPSGPRVQLPTPVLPWRAIETASSTATLSPPRATATQPEREVHISDLNAIAGVWDDIVSEVRYIRPLIATLLEHALPTAGSSSGVLTLQVDAPAALDGIVATMTDTLGLLRNRIVGLQRIVVRGATSGAEEPAAPRMTVESVKSDTLALLRKRDPVLAAAIDALDLELTD